jgi:hypothetical protein
MEYRLVDVTKSEESAKLAVCLTNEFFATGHSKAAPFIEALDEQEPSFRGGKMAITGG